MSASTRAISVLEHAGVAFTLHAYRYDPGASAIGLQAAQALGEPPARVLKTLMASVDGRPVCAIVPSDKELSLKRLAKALAGKSAQMMRPGDAERMTGYVVGGISPFGQKRQVPAAMEEQALLHEFVFLNAGQRGWQVKMSPADAARLLGAVVLPLAA
jgi:Cys-tRNA(Pro)/Cys-tRNA(Cys) deacylase